MNNQSDIVRLQEMIDEADKIVFFGGAGVSTESGIQDFRSKNGIYKEDVNAEMKLTRRYMQRHPDEFWQFYRRYFLPEGIKPNKAHMKLVELEDAGKLLGIITQNIDNLHQMAGSKKVYELHGNGARFYCQKCGKQYTIEDVKYGDTAAMCTEDNCNGLIRPDVVMYGESLPMDAINQSLYIIKQADLIIIGGTSMNVYPAAGLVHYRKRNSKCVIINSEPTFYDGACDLVIRDPIGEVLGQIEV